MMKKILVIILVFIMLFSISACEKKQDIVDNNIQSGTEQVETESIEVTDLKGNKVVFEELPERIVSLSPANTEILFALGAGEKVVGVTSYCNYPEETNNIDKIGNFEGANLELIKSAEPDVVLAGGYIQEDLISSLEALDIPVVSTEALDFTGIYDSIKLISEISGTVEKGKEIISDMENKIENTIQKTKDLDKPKVFYVVWTDPITTAGNKTFIDDIIKTAGGINTAEKVENWAKYSAEELLADNPDMLIASNFCTPEAVSKEYFEESDIFNKLDCVKDGKIYMISNDDIFSRPAPRVLEAIDELVKAFYGDI